MEDMGTANHNGKWTIENGMACSSYTIVNSRINTYPPVSSNMACWKMDHKNK